MNKKPVTILILAILLTTLCTPFLTSDVKAEPAFSITINQDGSIQSVPPESCPISTSDQETYRVTASFIGSIIVQKDNVVLEGQGFTVNAAEGVSYAIRLDDVEGVTVKDITVDASSTSAYFRCIYLDSSTSCVITDNEVKNNPAANQLGIFLWNSSDTNLVTLNTVTASMSGIGVEQSCSNRVIDNYIVPTSSGSGVRIANDAFFNNISDNRIKGPASGYGVLMFSNVVNNTFSRNTITGAYRGFYGETYNATIADNIIINPLFIGMDLSPVTNCTVIGNVINGTSMVQQGIYLRPYGSNYEGYENTTGNTITQNTIYGVHQGIYIQNLTEGMYCTYSNVITYNNITSTDTGIMIDGTYDNFIGRNLIVGGYEGIYVCTGSHDNTFVGNTLDNTFNAGWPETGNAGNTWDYNGRGNYWSDYVDTYPSAQETGTTGIWNTPYVVESSTANVDHYPLKQPDGLYILTVGSVGSGSPSLSTGRHYEPIGSEVQVTANPTSGKAFINWILDGANFTSNPITVTMSATHNLTAVFTPETKDLTVQSGENGIVIGNSYRLDGATTSFPVGTSCQLTAQANTGYAFAYWLINGSASLSNPVQLNMYYNYAVQAVFGQERHLTIESSANGAVYNDSNVRVDDSVVVVGEGGGYGLHASPNSGYVFSYWLVNGTQYSTDAETILTISGDQTVQAVYAMPPLHILPVSGAHAPITGKLLWSYGAGAPVYSTPVIANGIVYTTTVSGYVYAINATTSTPIWGFNAEDSIYVSPVVVEGVVYICTENGYVYALNANPATPEGEVIWSYFTDDYLTTQLVIDTGVVYVCSESGFVYAFSANPVGERGDLLWSFETDDSLYFAPTVVGNVAYVTSTDGYVYAIDTTDGTQIWSYLIDDWMDCSPVVVGNAVYVTAENGYIYAIGATNGASLWSYNTDSGIYCPPTVDNGVVYVPIEAGYVYAFNSTNGDILWSYSADDCFYIQPILVDGVIYVPSDNGYIYALDATPEGSDGQMLWCYVAGDYFIRPVIVADGIVYANSRNGGIYALNATPQDEEGELLWYYEAQDDIRCVSAAGEGLLCVGSTDGYVYTFADYSQVTFNAQGLPDGASWSVTFDGYTQTSTSTSIVLRVCPNDEYSYSITGPAGYISNTTSGTLALSGDDLIRDVSFSSESSVHSVTFTESGLPQGTSWTVTFGGKDHTSTSDSITFSEVEDGQYGYSITNPAGYSSNPSSGTVTVNGDNETKSITFSSTYTPPPPIVSYSLTVNSAVGGTTNLPSGTYPYNAGSIATITANASVGYQFSYWLLDGNANNAGATINVIMNGAHTLTPVFTQLTYQLTVNTANGGSTSIGSGTYVYGVTANVIAMPSEGYLFNHWVLDGQAAGTATSITIQMTENHTLAPVFGPIPYTLIVASTVGGSTTPAAGSYTYSYGQTATVTAIAADDYKFEHWILDGQNASAGSAISIQMFTNHTLTPVFAEIPVVLIATETTSINTTYPIAISGGNMTARQMTNMTITPYASNTTTVVALNVTGPSGTVGTGTIALPKESIPYGTIPKVYIDGVLAENQTYTEDADYFYVTFTTHFSEHTINIVFEVPAPLPTPTPTPTPSPTSAPTTTPTPTTSPTSTPTTSPTPTSTPQSTATPTPTSTGTATPTATTTPTTPTEAAFPSYIVVTFAVALALFVAFALVYRRRKNRW